MIEKGVFRAKDGANIYLAAILSLLFFQIIFSIIISSTYPNIAEIAEIDRPSGYYILSYLASICFQLGYLSVFIIYIKRRCAAPPIFVSVKLKPVFFVAAVLLPVLCLFCFYPVSYAVDLLLNKVNYPSMGLSEEVVSGSGALSVVLMVIATVVFAPVCEELVYRSGLVSGLSMRLRGRRGLFFSVLLGGLAFSLMHMSPRQTVFQFFLGCAAVMLALSSGSTIPSIILHFVNNLFVVLTFFSRVDYPFELMERFLMNSAAGVVATAIGFCILGILALFGVWYVLKRYGGKQKHLQESKENEEDKDIEEQEVALRDKKRFFVVLGLGLLICAVMWAGQLVVGLTA